MKTCNLFLFISGSVAFQSCGGFLQKSDSDSQEETPGDQTINGEDKDGVLIGTYSVSSSSTQVLSASPDSDIGGSAVRFPPGSLGLDTEVSLEQGASLTSSTLSQQLGLDAELTSGSKALVISSSTEQDAVNPFTLQIALSDTTLNLTASRNYAVIYKVFSKEKNNYFIGLIPTSEIGVEGKIVTFETRYFGSYQVVITSAVITKNIEVKTDTPILTAAKEKTLEEIEWNLGVPTFHEATRTASFSVSTSGFAELVRCSMTIHDSKSGTIIGFKKHLDIKLVKGKKSASFDYLLPDKKGRKIHGIFECEDKLGRVASSGKSAVLTIPEWKDAEQKPQPDEEEEEEEENSGGGEEEEEEEEEDDDDPIYTLAFTGNSLITSDPRTRVLLPNSSMLLTGTCASGSTVSLSGWGLSVSQSLSCNTGNFSALIGFDNNVASIAYLLDPVGMSEILVSQSGQETARTLLYKANAANDITYVGQATDSDTLALSSLTDISAAKFYVLEEDVSLSGNWTPLGDSTTPFEAIFDGNNKTISNVTIVASSDNVGFFGKVAAPASISNLRLENVDITVSGNYSNIGALVGYLDLAPIMAVGVSGTITLSGTSQAVGGFVGYSNQPYILRARALVDVNGTGSASSVGGFVGEAYAGIIEDAYAIGAISGIDSVGGFAGKLVAGGGSMIVKTFASGSVSCSGNECGGFIGSTSDQDLIGASYTTSTLTPGSGSAGGFAGSYPNYYLFGTYYSNAQAHPLGNDTDVASASECARVINISDYFDLNHDVYSPSGFGWDFVERWEATNSYPKFVWE